MSASQPVTLRFQYSPALHRPEAAQVTEVQLSLIETKRRHAAQAARLQQLGREVQVIGSGLPEVDPLLDQCACYSVSPAARQILFFDGEPQFREVLYLFNIIIALEWNPGLASAQTLRTSMARAAEFLYDVTNGYMSIGQVIIGGPDLMDVADIQIMASNRLHPRAWMAALNEERKFKPIRVGRGLWQKNQELLLPWDSPEGYRSLIHEWGHYAFGLRDEYLGLRRVERSNATNRFWAPSTSANQGWAETDELSMALPGVALSVESLMASTQISEFAKPEDTFATIRKYYVLLADDRPLNGPAIMPLPLPLILDLKARPRAFTSAGGASAAIGLDPDNPQEPVIALEAALAKAREVAAVTTGTPETYWLYLLKGPFQDGVPASVIAQGKLGKRDLEIGKFPLLGAAPGDRLVLMGQLSAQTVVLQATLTRPADATGADALESAAWSHATPPGLAPNASLFVDVIPAPIVAAEGQEPPMHADIRVRENAPEQPTTIVIYPSGAETGKPAEQSTGSRISQPVTVPHLDGHVLLRWAASDPNPEGYFICSYSQGGGPRTSSGGILPITAGSADGNAMIFFNDNVEPPTQPVPEDPVSLRLVTTTMTTGQQWLDPERTRQARSYIFSVAGNEALGSYKASLILYYDNEAPALNGDLLIYRWDEATTDWQRLSTFVRPDLPYVAVPLGVLDDATKTSLETAPGLTHSEAALHVERYRIFLTPS